jgi:hypothetical protein
MTKKAHAGRGQETQWEIAEEKSKTMKITHLLISLFTASLLGVGSGCCTSKQCQLEKVAKDWCMTIRASQVIPVYPLTEDVQPGDIFLVQVPIDKEQTEYDAKGFLPLNNLIARLNPTGYSNFYSHSFLYTNGVATLPHDWIRPPFTNWEPAPHAAFPSYSFSVKKGEGLNLAVPIDGVPVGLALMNSDAADGSVNIKEARTIGIDTICLWNQIQSWATLKKDFLKPFSPADGETNYVRVITRVYACGQMDVSLRNNSSQSGGLDVGAAKPVNLIFPQSSTNATNSATNATASVIDIYTNALNTLQNSLPGGSLRIAAASARTIALDETFVPPLIIGYLGFDCEILDNGRLGPPIPTHSHLNKTSGVHHGNITLPASTPDQIKAISSLTKRIGQLKQINDQDSAKTILSNLGITPKAGVDLFELLQDQVRAAALDHSQLPLVKTAFGI